MVISKKHCPRCDRDLDSAAFPSKGGYCGECRSAYAKDRYKAKNGPGKYASYSQSGRICRKCETWKEAKEFPPNPNIKCGLGSYCYDCLRAQGRKKFENYSDSNEGRFCRDCGEWKPAVNFPRNPALKHGLGTYCKDCDRKRDQVARALLTPEQRQRASESKKKYNSRPEVIERRKVNKKLRRQKDPAKAAAENAAMKARRRHRVKSGGNFTAKEFRDLCERYGGLCLCCGKAKPLTPDHVIPLAKAGANTIKNIQPLCLQCNMKKSDKTIDYRVVELELPCCSAEAPA